MKRQDDFENSNSLMISFGVAMLLLICLIVTIVFSENKVKNSSYDGFKKAQQEAMQRRGISNEDKNNISDLAGIGDSKLTSDELDIWTLPPTGRKETESDFSTKTTESSSENKTDKSIEIKEIEVNVLEDKTDTNTFSPSDFKDENGIKVYYNAGKKASSFGLELSWKQDKINMKRLKNSGCDFVLINVGNRGYASGKIVLDEAFSKNLDMALESGLKTGIVFTSYAVSKEEVLEEADVVLTAIRGYKLELPVFIKYEENIDDLRRTDGLSDKDLTDLCNYFVKEIRESGYAAGIYASREKLEQIALDELPECEILVMDESEAPGFNGQISFWQYGENSFNGVTNKANCILKFN